MSYAKDNVLIKIVSMDYDQTFKPPKTNLTTFLYRRQFLKNLICISRYYTPGLYIYYSSNCSKNLISHLRVDLMLTISILVVYTISKVLYSTRKQYEMPLV